MVKQISSRSLPVPLLCFRDTSFILNICVGIREQRERRERGEGGGGDNEEGEKKERWIKKVQRKELNGGYLFYCPCIDAIVFTGGSESL